MYRALALALALVLVAVPAHAYKLLGVKWAESRLPVAWSLSTAGSGDLNDGSDLQEVIRGFTTWDAVGCSKFAVKEPVMIPPDQEREGADGVNQVFWIHTNWRYGRYTLGVTTPAYNPNNGQILDADIVFNGQDYKWTTKGSGTRTDVFTIAVHEQGHFLGLEHSCTPEDAQRGRCTNATRNAVMFAAYEGYPKGINSDDIAGVCHLYPEPPKNECGSCADGALCANGLNCSDGPGGRLCRRTCTSDDACTGSGRCLPRADVPDAGFCACEGDLSGSRQPCTSTPFCQPGHLCAEVDGGTSLCRELCIANVTACPTGEACSTVSGGTVCAPRPMDPPDGGTADGGSTGGTGTKRRPDTAAPGCPNCAAVPGSTLGGLLAALALLRRRRNC